ncbi:Hypothetical predicted protein [Lecanosticta acicola]|uniref:NTF2-like domain-containing protein n=1 Tax=Lecanosticta acicola TaxID=111012 RepID=A0AAI9EB39_9PEZI|nr:Hypothetical predicted protein [Lecanosticta acicola]
MFPAIFCLGFLAFTALAQSDRRPYAPPCEATCLTGDEVNRLLDGFKNILLKRSSEEEAAQIVTEDFTCTSDSVNYVHQNPLNTTTTQGREALLNEHHGSPVADIKTLFSSYTCDSITWYLEIEKELPVRIIAIYFVDNQIKKIYKAYEEGNAAVDLHQIGNPECQPGFKVSVGKEGIIPGSSNCNSGACGQPMEYGGSRGQPMQYGGSRGQPMEYGGGQ